MDVIAFDGHSYAPSYNKKGQITGDYGYILLVHEYQHTHLLVFGNWPHGTEIAVKFLTSSQAKSTLSHLMAKKIKAVIVVHGEVRGLSNGSIRLVDVHTIA